MGSGAAPAVMFLPLVINGTILHYNGAAWSKMTSNTLKSLYAVWGSSGSDVFAVGDSGTIMHYNGSTWSKMSSSTIKSLYAVWGSSGSDVFAVGDSGTIMHYNGTTWSSMASGTTAWLNGVWGSSGIMFLRWVIMEPSCTMTAVPGVL